MPLLKIYIVDDDPEDLEIMQIATSECCSRCTLYTFHSALDLLVFLLSQEKPDADLILMDALMPRIDGLRCIKSLKEHADLKSIPVYIVTGGYDEQLSSTFLMLGAASVDEKPGDYHKLKLLIRRILEDAIVRRAEKEDYR